MVMSKWSHWTPPSFNLWETHLFHHNSNVSHPALPLPKEGGKVAVQKGKGREGDGSSLLFPFWLTEFPPALISIARGYSEGEEERGTFSNYFRPTEGRRRRGPTDHAGKRERR